MIFKSGSFPMKFFMSTCTERDLISQLIESNGGELLDHYNEGVIELVPYDLNFMLKSEIEHPLYSYKFVIDSVTLNCLQNLKEYLIPVINPKRNSNEQARKIAYTEEENEIIKKYVLENSGNPNNVCFWKCAKEKINFKHSADSLRAHWRVIDKKQASKENKFVRIKPFLSKNDGNHEISGKNQIEMQAHNNTSSNIDESQQLCQKKEAFIWQSEESFVNNEEIKKSDADSVQNEKKLIFPSSNSEILMSLKSEMFNSSYSKYKSLCKSSLDPSKIDELFSTLVDLCCLRSNIALDPVLVAKVLILKNGSVHETLSFDFSSNFHN